MGDVAVGARSGHDDPEEGHEQLAESPAAVTDMTINLAKVAHRNVLPTSCWMRSRNGNNSMRFGAPG